MKQYFFYSFSEVFCFLIPLCCPSFFSGQTHFLRKLAVISKIKQTHTRTVVMSHVFDLFLKRAIILRKNPITFVYKTHTRYQIQTQINFNQTESCILIQAHFLVESRMDNFSVIWGGSCCMLRLWCCCCWSWFLLGFVIVNCYCLCSGQSHLKIVKVGWWKRRYQFQIDKHCPSPLLDLPN